MVGEDGYLVHSNRIVEEVSYLYSRNFDYDEIASKMSIKKSIINRARIAKRGGHKTIREYDDHIARLRGYNDHVHYVGIRAFLRRSSTKRLLSTSTVEVVDPAKLDNLSSKEAQPILPQPEESIDNDLWIDLQDEIGHLFARERRILEMHHIEGLSYEQISRKENITKTRVGQINTRAEGKLRIRNIVRSRRRMPSKV